MTPNEDFFVMNNYFQIYLGIIKVFCTFEVPNTLQVARSYQNIGGIFYVTTLDTVEKRCRNYRDGLNTIVPPVGIRQRKVRHRFLLCNMPKIHSIKMKNNTINLHPTTGCNKLPQELSKAIERFFDFHGSPTQIDEKYWQMMESTILGVEHVGLSVEDVLQFMFLYKTTKDLFIQLYPYFSESNNQSCNN